MLKQLQKRKDDQGFTIIEVLIVLAIAALILVVVLIAVPNLQRSQRNSARKSEASRILTAANTYISNNNGQPLTDSSQTQAQAIITEAGGSSGLQQYAGVSAGASNTLVASTLNIAAPATVSATAAPTAPAKDGLLLVQGAVCDPVTGPGAYKAGSSSRSLALIYTLEAPSGLTVACMSN